MTETAAAGVRYSPAELSTALGLFPPTDEQAAVIAAPPGPVVVIAGAGAGKTETMAARVVWLVANGYATPSQVLGLTFTRKAAGQLLRRVRTRLARLAGAGLAPPAGGADETATVSTYHAFAGTLLREHGLLLPVEPDARLLSETERWQLAFEVVCAHPGQLAIQKTPAAVTDMVLRLAGALAEHLVDTDQLRDTHVELERLVHTLPAGPYQRDRGPSQWLLKMLATQTERTELVPLIDALHQRMRADKVMDFGMQMSAAARLASRFPQVGEQLRQRFRVVLLDEYQDTGHAQRVALSSLFGGGVDDGLALTAVGDPIQSIYGWRGASATNLPRFTTDFPMADGTPAPTLELRTSWRNPPSALHLANAVSAEARRRSVTVHELRPRPDAEPGTIRCALLNDVEAERDWVADHLARIYHGAVAQGADTPTAAVLVRRNADAAPMAEALSVRGVPVEVVGVAGLLAVPEVADLVAMLRLVADPAAGSAVMRVLTGPRWRFGARDIAALWRRARELDDRTVREPSPAEIVAQAAPDADSACLADALCDPGAAEHYSPAGYQRIEALGRELTMLRAHLSHPLPELVAEVRRVTGLDAEARAARPVASGWTGTENLDTFCDLVADFAGRPGASVLALLAYLDVATEVENGLAPAELTVSQDRVQILTVHAAKGLEWQVVAVPHLSGRVFPSTASARTWLTDPSDLPPLLRGDRATESELGVPVLDTSDINDRKILSDKISDHKRSLEQRRIDEERRLLYVAITRSEDTLLISGHHWGATESKPRGPSDFLCEIKSIVEDAAAQGRPCGEIEQWAPDPPPGEVNPLRDKTVESIWPAAPARVSDVDRGARLVAQALTGGEQHEGADREGWAADVDALLAERDRAPQAAQVELPGQLSVSTLVELSRDRRAALQRLRRRLPQRPDPHALLGTAFHEWVQRFFHSERLFDLDDLPGAVDSDSGRAHAAELSELQDAFVMSPWAARTPIEVEVPFDMAIGQDRTIVVRGRIDAVFAQEDGTTTVVDWKTGEPPATPEGMAQAAIQLAVYRLAWASLRGCPPESVRAAFHYVRSGQTVSPEALPGEDELVALLTDQEAAAPGAVREP
ncbi:MULTISPECIES: ATP-dependent helicase [Mycolicibacterium]|uniref:DNA 3'-5' helicase n=1 Tax=Mycolicibacterium senegalense TaxID=1796 RepID=A0A378W1Y4_9MYCO|nr:MULTISPECIES: ATP-dependent DNA helicase [Mycolicibacterium]MCV7336634.1 ATP-dependent helicase [Mycolicibacterium senegalense]MDR7291520.1 DNA helicase-2/ATP-dependent DNA helicase PcrA [Mycolicibacterium senegalense]QZA22996.1 ATP-dependent helicase [Mycolicibacterium senegalense]CDP84302.1 ATP-dependent DNA helicase [Mycolicibacterium farcinogenes]SUA27127.1 UvrD/REP helicase [Mycolicibacterium senegalense]